MKLLNKIRINRFLSVNRARPRLKSAYLLGNLLSYFVLALVFLTHLTGCSGLLNDKPEKPINTLNLLNIPNWERPLPSHSNTPQASHHSSDVLDVRQTSSNPPQITSIGGDGAVINWNLQDGSGRTINQVGSPIQLAALGRKRALMAWTADHKVFVACGFGCSNRWELKRLKTRVTAIAFHEDDSALIIGGTDGRVYRWRFQIDREATEFKEKDRALERYIGHQTVISGVLPLHTGRAFFSSDWDGQLYAWLAYTADDYQGSYDRNLFGGRFFGNVGTFMFATRPADRGITSMALSEDGARLALGTDDGFVEIWEVRGFEMIARMASHNGRVISVALNKDGTRLASVGRDSRIIAGDITPDSMYGVKVGATRSMLTTVLTEEMKTARGVRFLSSDDLLITTSDGRLGVLALSNTPRVPAPAPIKVDSATQTVQRGSDY